MVVKDGPNLVRFQVCRVFHERLHALLLARIVVVLVFQLLLVVDSSPKFRIKISVDQLLSGGLHLLGE